ncbi:sensor histidine kinase [Gymnodinialimonas ulvae]|uniref:sensor histidine kinase n=1 Tax=Gymnodinialimonas ulvae TaxID=3126504 RepID=UPI0030A0E453
MTKAIFTLCPSLLALSFAGLPAGAVTFDVPAQNLTDVADAAIVTAAFFTGTLTAIVVLIAIALSLRQWIWAQYTVLVLLGLIYIALFEQNITGIVWSGFDISARMLVACGFAMLAINYLIAAQAIPPGHRWAWLKGPFRLAALAMGGLWLLSTAVSPDAQYLLFSAAGCTVAVAHFFPVATFSKLRGGYDRIIRNLIWILLTAVLIGGTFVIAGGREGASLTIAVNRVLIAAITIGFGALFVRNIFILKSDRELAVQEALERAEEKARINEALLVARDNHRAAVEIAHNRNLRLATASHDIRQPLSSLRTSFAALTRDMPQDTRDHLQTSLDYLDELAASYITEAATDAGPLAKQERVPVDDAEDVRTEQIAETLRRMFAEDAAERDLALRMEVAPAALRTQPLALMRVLCNVMSNAIAHGTPGPLDVSGTQTAAGYVFEIRNPGASDLAFATWDKGEASGGSGLGLAIVREQAARAGLSIATPDRGPDTTCIAITVPTDPESRAR